MKNPRADRLPGGSLTGGSDGQALSSTGVCRHIGRFPFMAHVAELRTGHPAELARGQVPHCTTRTAYLGIAARLIFISRLCTAAGLALVTGTGGPQIGADIRHGVQWSEEARGRRC